jgi:hypothetical protein
MIIVPGGLFVVGDDRCAMGESVPNRVLQIAGLFSHVVCDRRLPEDASANPAVPRQGEHRFVLRSTWRLSLHNDNYLSLATNIVRTAIACGNLDEQCVKVGDAYF